MPSLAGLPQASLRPTVVRPVRGAETARRRPHRGETMPGMMTPGCTVDRAPCMADCAAPGRATLAAVDRRRRERRHLSEEEFVLGLVEDRRAALRRERMEPRSPERRRGERRGPLPVSWTALDCVVIHVSDPR